MTYKKTIDKLEWYKTKLATLRKLLHEPLEDAIVRIDRECEKEIDDGI